MFMTNITNTICFDTSAEPAYTLETWIDQEGEITYSYIPIIMTMTDEIAYFLDQKKQKSEIRLPVKLRPGPEKTIKCRPIKNCGS